MARHQFPNTDCTSVREITRCQTGVPHALDAFSPTPITHAVVVLNSIKVHEPVLALTVSTVVVPCWGFEPRHCGVSPNCSTMVLNTVCVASHATGLIRVRGSAITAVATVSNKPVKNVRMNLFTKKRQVLH